MNPTKALNEKIINLKADLKNTELLLNSKTSAYKSLKTEHEQLITTSCDIDNRLSDLNSDVEQFCDNCTEKFGAVCSECVLNKYLS